MNQFLASIPDIYVINLDHRTDRWNDFCSRWSDILDFSRVHRVSAVLGKDLPGFGELPWFTPRTQGREGTWAGAAGCTLSHRRALELAKKTTSDYVLILEDDATPSEWLTKLDTPEGTQQLTDFLESNTSWGICYLGYTFKPMSGVPVLSLPDSWKLWKVPGVLCMHAAIVHHRAIDTILDNFPTQETIWAWIARFRAIDTWLMRHFESTSGLDVIISTPQLIIQADSVSDIVNREVVHDHSDICLEPHEVTPTSYSLRKIFLGSLHRLLLYCVECYKYVRTNLWGFPGKH